MVAWLVHRAPPPAVNQAQARAMLPAVDAYLDRDAARLNGGYLASAYPKMKVMTFCDASIIEIRADGTQWRVGMEVNCGEFARRRDTLVVGTAGYPGTAEVMTLAYRGGEYHPFSLNVGPGHFDPEWAKANFSPGGAAEIDSASPPTAPNPMAQARRALGFPPGTPAISP